MHNPLFILQAGRGTGMAIMLGTIGDFSQFEIMLIYFSFFEI